LAVGMFINMPFGFKMLFYLLSYILVGGEVLYRAVGNIRRGQVFDENFLMAIATLGAFAIEEYPEAVAVMLFYQIGEFFQEMAVDKSRKSIATLMDIRPDYANLKTIEGLRRVCPQDVSLGELILVKPGEKVPLDGKIIEGYSLVDTSALTGESIPREVDAGSEVLAGFINQNGILTVEVTKLFEDSAVSRILELVENASNKKAKTEKFITSFARYYTPVVVITALFIAVIPPFIIEGAIFSDWLYRALVFLVISCPCALVVSIPLGFFGGIGAASKNGILVKGGNYLEALKNIDTVVLDKTGTVTKGIFQVTEIKPANDMTKEKLLEYAAYAEGYSNHPIALSILRAYGKDIDKKLIEDYQELSGYGIKMKLKGKEIIIGNKQLMLSESVSFENLIQEGTTIHVGVDKKYAGHILIADELKEDAESSVRELKQFGIKIVMLTGDNDFTAQKVGRKLGIDKVYGELLPEGKVEMIELLEKQKTSKGKIVFVGDGINDAPVLARADIGIAMGGLGSDAAIEAADVVLMTDELSKVGLAIKIAKRTNNIVWQNIILALGVKGIVLALGAGGVATLWEAVFADVGVALIAVLNSTRVIKSK
ncbi:MAG: cadmium-translocating P-type ATPase, partial [Alkaliphilus sp.]|nr:cadmium-translocating P-type ATPase [Alkaliphilus sp.]